MEGGQVLHRCPCFSLGTKPVVPDPSQGRAAPEDVGSLEAIELL